MRFNWVLDIFYCVCGWLVSMNKVWDLLKKAWKKSAKKIVHAKEPKSISSMAEMFFSHLKWQFQFVISVVRSFSTSVSPFRKCFWCASHFIVHFIYLKDYYYFFISKSLFAHFIFTFHESADDDEKAEKFAITFLFHNWRVHHISWDNTSDSSNSSSNTATNSEKVFNGNNNEAPHINSLIHTLRLPHCSAQDIIIIEDKTLSVKMRDKQWNAISWHHTITITLSRTNNIEYRFIFTQTHMHSQSRPFSSVSLSNLIFFLQILPFCAENP